MIRLIRKENKFTLRNGFSRPHETDEKANVMSFLIILAPSLDLLSILLKTNSNKIVFLCSHIRTI